MSKITMKELVERIEVLEAKIVELESRAPRDRGPKSERAMTEEDARRVILGDLSNKSHKECAEILNLSYGQIYSARGGYTFKKITDEKIANKES